MQPARPAGLVSTRLMALRWCDHLPMAPHILMLNVALSKISGPETMHTM